MRALVVVLAIFAAKQAVAYQPVGAIGSPRQYFTPWVESVDEDGEPYFSRWLMYKRNPDDRVYQKRAIYAMPDRPGVAYVHNPKTGKYIGRFHWDGSYDDLPARFERRRYRELREEWFEPIGAVELWESSDGELAEPPDHPLYADAPDFPDAPEVPDVPEFRGFGFQTSPRQPSLPPGVYILPNGEVILVR